MRKYDSDFGRFTSIDPLWEKYRSFSPYVYSMNNPLSIIDPTGKAGEAIVNFDDNSITVSAHYIFYGNAANDDNAKKVLDKMQSDWNKAGEECIKIKGMEFSVKFDFTYEILSRGEALSKAGANGLNVCNNFIKLTDETNEAETSEMGGNSGWWSMGQFIENGTTPSHEIGHGFGINIHTKWEPKMGTPDIMSIGVDKKDRTVQTKNLITIFQKANIQNQESGKQWIELGKVTNQMF